jgi:hypothetical protein
MKETSHERCTNIIYVPKIIYLCRPKKKNREKEDQKLFENGFLDFLKNERGGRRKKEAHPWLQTEFLRSNSKKCSSNYRWNRSKTQASQKKKPSPALRETRSLETNELAK